jgi:hypothetical protein
VNPENTSNLDRELQRALRPNTPPAGFEARVLRGIAEHGRITEPLSARRGVRRVRPLALGLAAAVLLAIAGVRYETYSEAARTAERNREKVATALRVVSETLQTVQIKVANASVIRGDHNESRQP